MAAAAYAPVSYARDRATASMSGAAGVRLSPDHILSKSVHAFHVWTGERTLLTWCEIPVDLAAGGTQTTDLIGCLACAEASWRALRLGERF